MNKLKESFSHFKTQKSSPVVDIVWTDSESGDHCQCKNYGHFSLSVNYTSEPDDQSKTNFTIIICVFLCIHVYKLRTVITTSIIS